MTPDLQLVPAKSSDFEILKDIHHVTMKPHVSKIWGWNQEDQDNYFRKNFHLKDTWLVLQGKQVAGSLQYWQTNKKLALVNLLLLPEFQKKGIGSQIVTELLEQARQFAVPLELGVFKINTGAKRLYERLGLKVYDETETHFLMRS